MNTTQLEIVTKLYGFGMELSLRGNKLMVANDGFVTDDLTEITAKKHSGKFGGFYYQYTKKEYISEMIRVIQAISQEQAVLA